MRQTTVRELVGFTCDGCGFEGELLDMVLVEIAVNEGDEGGRRDIYDFCDPCVVQRAPLLQAAGSRAPYVTGEYLPPDDDEYDR